MVLQRQGNKKALFKKIEKYIPEHEIYIEPFLERVDFLPEREPNIISSMIWIMKFLICFR